MELSSATRAIITGAASGIGQATAIALARRGAALWLTDIDATGLERTAAEIRALGGTPRVTACDLTDFEQLDALVAQIKAEWPAPNLLVNSAGVAAFGPTLEMSESDWTRVLTINLLAPIRLTNALLPVLIAQPAAHVVNLCSIFGLTPMARIAPYQTSKYGLVGYSMALDAEYGHRGFGVSAVCPGIVRTAMAGDLDRLMAKSQVRIPSWIGISPEAVAKRILVAIERNHGLVVVAPMAQLLWRLTRLAPFSVRWAHQGQRLSRLFLQRLPPV